MKKGFVIAIDGPVASGKGTIAPTLAKTLQGFYLYTGAMYRGLAYYCQKNNISFSDTSALIAASKQINISFKQDHVFLNNEDVTEALKDPDIAKLSAIGAVIPEVRARMVTMQQEIAQKFVDDGTIVIAEGRDTATIAFPDAEMKIFLTAVPEERAKRRLAQYIAQGETQSFEEVLQQVKARDEQDMMRAADPLVSDPEAHGYFVVDSTDLTLEQTIEIIRSELIKRNLV